MKKEVKKILLNFINDFNSKWTSHTEKDAGVSEYAEQILKLFSQSDVLWSVPIQKDYSIGDAQDRIDRGKDGWG